MITHVVSFRWKAETPAERIDAIVAALTSLPDRVPGIASYRFGADLGANGSANMDFAIVATFDSVEDWETYDEHPEHEAVRADVIRPWIAERAAVQFRS